MNAKIQVVIVDDYPLFREGVAHTLQVDPDIEVVGQGATADDAIRLACDLLPDLILLDIDMPGGLSAIQAIAASCPVTKIVMLTVSSDEDNVVAAFKAGARAYILKGIAARELLSIVRSVCNGEGYVPPALAASLLSEMVRALPGAPVPASPLDALTEREQQILEQVAAGFSNKEIAQRLSL